MKPWLDVLADGKVEVPLISVTLLGTTEKRYEGTGQITWSEHEGIRLQAITNSEDFFDDGLNFPVGKLLGSEGYLQLEGMTYNSHAVVVEHIINDHFSFNGTGTRVWDKPIDCLHLYNQAGPAHPTVLRGILRPLKTLSFSQISNVRDDNPIFGVESSRVDWVKYATNFAECVLRKGTNDTVLVFLEADMTLEELEHALESLRLAVSFIEGRSVGFVGFEAVCKGFHHRKAYGPQRKRKSTFSSPLPTPGPMPHQHAVLSYVPHISG